jgi:hypothetical protein
VDHSLALQESVPVEQITSVVAAGVVAVATAMAGIVSISSLLLLEAVKVVSQV